MESTQIACPNCSKALSSIAYFCGACLTQIKCKSCGSFLEKDYIGCINCGTPKEVTMKANSAQNINTFRLHETSTDRTIEATFSDTVGKDLAGILRDASANRLKSIEFNGTPKETPNEDHEQESDELVDAEVINAVNGDEGKPEPKKDQEILNSSSNPVDYPTLKAIAMKNLPNSETEWVVVYAFYASKFGIETFTRKNIIDKYSESNRLSDEKKKGLTTYIKNAVKGGFLNPLTTDFSILPKGIEKAQEIVSRTNGSSPKPSSKKQKEGAEDSANVGKKARKNSGGTKTYKRLTNINFYPPGQKSLKDFIKEYSIKNDNERNLLFTHYLSEVLKIDAIQLDHIYTCYDEVNHKIPENLIKSIGNTKNRTGWLESQKSNISITTKGRNKIKFWDKKDKA